MNKVIKKIKFRNNELETLTSMINFYQQDVEKNCR
jgi:hypothetical protein